MDSENETHSKSLPISPELDSFESSLAEDLRETFREELPEILQSLEQYLAALADPGQQEEACAALGSQFHTVKGSAATVGMEDLSELGRNLQTAFEGPEEQGPELPLSHAFFSEISPSLCKLCAEAGLPSPEEALEIAATAARQGESDGPTETAPAAPPDPEREAFDREMLDAFRLDADAALEAAENAMVLLEAEPGDPAPLRTLFRQFHTLKGAAAAVELAGIVAQMEAGETLLEEVLEKRKSVPATDLHDCLLQILDSAAGLIAESRQQQHQSLILRNPKDLVETALAKMTAQPPPAENTLRTAGESASQPQRPPPIAPAKDTDGGVIRVHSSRLDLLMSRISELVVSRTQLDDGMSAIQEMREKLSVDRMRLGETIEGFRSFEFHQPKPAATPTPTGEARGPTHLDAFTDLEFDKYDDFNVLTRTLVELASDTSEVVEQVGLLLDSLGDESRQISKVTSSLQRTVSDMRLVSLDSLHRRLAHAARDAARQSGKEVLFECHGGDVQLDRSLIESLYGPLLHLVRNAVAHGIQRPEERRQQGKSAAGRITLDAKQSHGHVEIRVQDDGAGLDFNSIRNRARERKILDESRSSDPDYLSGLIFEPGFSTQETADTVSGRGVGMDVVASEVARLRGSVTIQAEREQGTEIRIHIPLTSMIEQILLLRAGTETIALTQGPVETVININPEDLQEQEERYLVAFENDWLPALPLHRLLGCPPGADPQTAVILRCGDTRVALLVEKIESQREAVIRPLGPLFHNHPFISSATLRGDGNVVFALDASRLHAAWREHPSGADRPLEKRTEISEAAVLWAEDSISVRKLAHHFLEGAGVSGDTAVDGREALDRLRSGQYRVLITDLEMPRMHGYELLHAVRNDPQLKEIPVIICSSRGSEKHRQLAQQSGASGYLTKPFTQEAVIAALEAVLPEL
ncbi:MAG: response regulator [Candidatus Binatia bacterium]|nr:response regulator [Candidatus Binatia bacterium]MDG2010108.1 response regulator [Candidatus Binatia bacterium]